MSMMEVDGGGGGALAGYSSSPVSSPPGTPPQTSRDETPSSFFFSGAGANNTAAPYIHDATNPDPTAALDPAKPKKAVRKKKDPADKVKAADGKKAVRQPRKPREPKDPNAPPRKRQKVENGAPASASASASEPVSASASASALQHHHSHIMPAHASQPLAHAQNNGAVPTSAPGSAALAAPIKHEPIITPSPLPASVIQSPRPSSSGRRYDPVRGIEIEVPAPTPPSTNASPTRPSTVQLPTHSRTSIASLTEPSPSPSSAFTRPPTSTPIIVDSLGPKVQSPPDSKLKQATSVDDDRAPPLQSIDESAAVKTRTEKPSETAPKAAAARDREERGDSPALPPMGKGLLSHSTFGKVEPETKKKEVVPVPNQCIVIEVPLNGHSNTVVNFLKEVEDKYGFDAAHPRLAEHRRRMKHMNALSAALEADSSKGEVLDDSDSESSDAAMGGVDEPSNNDTPGAKPKGRPKGRKKNEYNVNDDFIDDSELMWEQQALAVKDGYFVWSGPLVNEEEKANPEKPDGTTSTRGRGRGRGRGTGRGGGPGSRGGKVAEPGSSGRGSRGGATVRKPRVTKADRARMELEKQEREKMAASAARPAGYPGAAAV